jgi:hypothetical protein
MPTFCPPVRELPSPLALMVLSFHAGVPLPPSADFAVRVATSTSPGSARLKPAVQLTGRSERCHLHLDAFSAIPVEDAGLELRKTQAHAFGARQFASLQRCLDDG